MRVKVIIKLEKDKDNNTVFSTKEEMSMKQAKEFVKEYDKKGVLWMKRKWFDGWHNRYKILWERINK